MSEIILIPVVGTAIVGAYAIYVTHSTKPKKCPCRTINLALKVNCYECKNDCNKCAKLERLETACLMCIRHEEEKANADKYVKDLLAKGGKQ